MASRPRTGRGITGRDGAKDIDYEADIRARIIEGLKKAKEYNDTTNRLGHEIDTIQADIGTKGGKQINSSLNSSITWLHRPPNAC